VEDLEGRAAPVAVGRGVNRPHAADVNQAVHPPLTTQHLPDARLGSGAQVEATMAHDAKDR